MFFLTRERQEVFDAAHTYPFEEEIDSEFEEHLYLHLAQYIDVLPQKFQLGIIERTLFRNDTLMDEFEEWCNVTIEQFTTKGNAIYEKREAIVTRFNPSAQTVFSQSFHDGKIIHAKQQGDTFTLLLDMSGGFTVESIVQLVFHDVQTEGKLEGNYVYDELIEIAEGFVLRVLSSFGSPYREWTIFFKEVKASCLYRPAVYIEPGEVATWGEYVSALNPEDKYYIVKDMRFVEVDLASLSQTENGISAGGISLGDHFEEARERIYCATYEDPYAHFSEPIPTDELSFAMFDIDPTIRVRAFNTIFALGEDVAYIVNAALRKANVNEEEDMYFGILASHFDQLGCLEDDVKHKWLSE
ncbi:DUF4085 domain-containing protein [Saccharococcus sp. Marseille-Q5394]|uniref:DUF4085 domain-containing protein n=1 Tax=Saccharococcus sp. Marseille-Q5394 TaxID=2972778 RepID=UPI0021C9F782|nr:DUF4085 domain-containing protein [Saccharococcus sp. Marseille-Q5394]